MNGTVLLSSTEAILIWLPVPLTALRTGTRSNSLGVHTDCAQRVRTQRFGHMDIVNGRQDAVLHSRVCYHG